MICDEGKYNAWYRAPVGVGWAKSDDLHILLRTVDANAKNAHNSNLITFHTVRHFRDLRY